ncbi:TOTE conflict system archaeo-eukaryotic primase domain-containing protein [Clostridium drakei]|uniref:Helicase n=1 Tax=Clostridium drakei TaxID=332101 RepID=A0A2U8DVF5_9CLOT|nr:DEAD/DEAH box helicase family protein [Clostridium drakei]AWI06776.1 helicase [Clostridium drakei]
MKYYELYNEYIKLLEENKVLKIEIEDLRKRLRIENSEVCMDNEDITLNESDNDVEIPQSECIQMNNNSSPECKIKLFMSLFKGREDVYAKRWENKEGKSGYSPVCMNEWRKGICYKPKIKCSDCKNRRYGVLDISAINKHLRGIEVLGIYPILKDDTCHFLAIDFDDDGWEKDINILREVCEEKKIPFAIERSRSGAGAHIWFFFKESISAASARKFGTGLLTYAMTKRHQIKFESYDRLFPNQDTMPKGGFGNLIALPMQRNVRRNKNSVFIDKNLEPYKDQWDFLSSVGKLTKDEIEFYISEFCSGDELGELKEDAEEENKPWKRIRKSYKLSNADFPTDVHIIKANMIFINKKGFSSKTLNSIKRMAAFKNPEFYKAQAMRLPTFDKPRVISLSEETSEYLCLPRGTELDLYKLFNKNKVNFKCDDERYIGKTISVTFNGELREEQAVAAEAMLKHDNGVLSATTGFGKTVIGAKLIAERRVNTLIIVHTQQLLDQWKERLGQFLVINEVLETENVIKRGRKKKSSIIGQIGAGKNSLNGIIDIAIMQSLVRKGEVKELVKDYGMVLVDECHHVSAFNFEQILKNVAAKYVYGLTATPIRKDGHHPIIFMQCGPIRYKVDARKQAEKQPFEHYVIPRFTSFRKPICQDKKEWSIAEMYSEISTSEIRNELIVNDVISCVKEGRNPIVLTERTSHVETLADALKEKVPNVIILTGRMSSKDKKAEINKLLSIPKESNVVIVATGKFVGEGFDEPRLDTLFLAMPISWKGTLQQYAGRLHRIYENKNEVQIYDYVDIHVNVLERMYEKRLKGYASIGYSAKSDSKPFERINSIYNNNNFLTVFSNDIFSAKHEIIIFSPFISKRRLLQMLKLLMIAIKNGSNVKVVTRPETDFKESDKEALKEMHELIRGLGVDIIFKTNIHQKFAIVDKKIVWYGSINLLSFGRAEESIMRLESINIANELLGTFE